MTKQKKLNRLKPNSEKYNKLQTELSNFYTKVTVVLEERFYTNDYRSLCAILYSIPANSLEELYQLWLDELFSLGLLKWESIKYYRGL